MSEKIFVDTNVWFYAMVRQASPADVSKSVKANSVLASLPEYDHRSQWDLSHF